MERIMFFECVNGKFQAGIYFGPKTPKGLENNWIPTAGKRPYLMFRFYGPEEAF
jgi:hypothetical protein